MNLHLDINYRLKTRFYDAHVKGLSFRKLTFEKLLNFYLTRKAHLLRVEKSLSISHKRNTTFLLVLEKERIHTSFL